ncbi:hypothetical protein LNAOJCKE_2077 [Methylorubrum aminovorans]|uniref:Uncharacterized protein n=1 Tax=Methylorubrum aminovorans TaxID=269069 RepID=A0ABQ4UC26_9HYPH|nr:hypothetical protein LNAOJCKE_2077 [Methylorubrum aminovorans]
MARDRRTADRIEAIDRPDFLADPQATAIDDTMRADGRANPKVSTPEAVRTRDAGTPEGAGAESGSAQAGGPARAVPFQVGS